MEYFQLVTGVQSLDVEAGKITTFADVPMESTIFEGHFPGNPIMPGVLLIECMAQTCGYLILAKNGFEEMPFLASVRTAKLRQFVEPGARLEVDAVLDGQSAGLAAAKAKVRFDGKVVADAEIRFRVLPFPSEETKNMMLDFADSVGLREKSNIG
jgi:3-hydroxyacyl-[acyl-carrier-protein] dehydratase